MRDIIATCLVLGLSVDEKKSEFSNAQGDNRTSIPSTPSNVIRIRAIEAIPRPFASIHVRYGDKEIEQEPEKYPVKKFIGVLRGKYPHIRNVFVSTESAWVLPRLIRDNPDLRFYFIDYHRIEKLEVYRRRAEVDYAQEMVFSMANLWVAAEADAFIGTLTSNWCQMILGLERTRGDGGFDYQTVDGTGSSFTACF